MIFEYIKLSVSELFNNKLRTFLSLIGIVIGVAVVYVILSLNDIAKIAIVNQISGKNGIVNINYVTDKNDKNSVFYASLSSNGGGYASDEYKFNSEDESELSKLEGISGALGHYSSNINVKFDRKSTGVDVKRNSKGFMEFYDLEVIAGKRLEEFNENNQMSIILVSDKFVKDVMKISNQESIGKTLNLKNRLFTIVGVIKTTNSNSMYYTVLPQTAYDSMFSSGSIKYMAVKVTPGYDLDKISESAVYKLNELHGTLNTKSGYVKEDLSYIISSITQVTDTLSLVMSIIASISLLVAGIGVMNIMLVSVIERTREIGVKRAIGASKGAIQFQFINC